MDPRQRVIVVAHGHAITSRADVELEAVAARDRERGEERRQRVLGRGAPVAAVGEPEGARSGCHAGTDRPSPDRQVGRQAEVVGRVERRVADRRPVEGEPRTTRR